MQISLKLTNPSNHKAAVSSQSASLQVSSIPRDSFVPNQSVGTDLGLIPPPALTAEKSPARTEGELPQAFRDSYHTELYQSRECGKNIRRFLEKLSGSEDLKGAKVLGIENKGFSYFGLVRARHSRDIDRFGKPRTTDMNWHHHVVLEKDGKIYDFDYGTEPQSPTTEEYFQTMFFDDPDVKADRKRKDYEIQVIDAKEYLERDKDTSVKMRLGEYLQF